MNKFLFFLPFLILAFWYCLWYDLPLWYDEIVTLREFVFTDAWKATVYYPFPNNHILYSLFLQLVSPIFSYHEMADVLFQAPWLRIWSVIAAAGVLYIVFRFAKNILKLQYPALPALLLASSISFLNASLQIRGYPFSLFFSILLLYILHLEFKQKVFQLISILLLSFALLYTMPSNIYFLLPLGMYWFWKERKQIFTSAFYHCLSIYIALGAILAALAYAPIYQELLNNDQAAISSETIWYVPNLILGIFHQYLEVKFLQFGIILFGIFFFIRRTQQQPWVLISTLIGGVLIASLHQKIPFERTFLVFMPPLVLLTARYIEEVIKTAPKLIAIIPILLISEGIYSYTVSQQHIQQSIQQHTRPQNLHSNYFISPHFNPKEVFDSLASITDSFIAHKALDKELYFNYAHIYQLKFSEQQERDTNHTVPILHTFPLTQNQQNRREDKRIYRITTQ